MQVDGPLSNDTASGIIRHRLSPFRQKRSKKETGRAHFPNVFLGDPVAGRCFCIHRQDSLFQAAFTAQAFQYPHHGKNVLDLRHMTDHGDAVGQQGRRHHGQHRIFGSPESQRFPLRALGPGSVLQTNGSPQMHAIQYPMQRTGPVFLLILISPALSGWTR